jgi:hypothetical protein
MDLGISRRKTRIPTKPPINPPSTGGTSNAQQPPRLMKSHNIDTSQQHGQTNDFMNSSLENSHRGAFT